MRITLADLIALTVDPAMRFLRRLWLDHSLRQLYRHRHHYAQEVKANQANLQWTDKQIALLESDRRRL